MTEERAEALEKLIRETLLARRRGLSAEIAGIEAALDIPSKEQKLKDEIRALQSRVNDK